MHKLKVLSLPYLIWMFIFILVPIVMIAFFAFTNEDGSPTIQHI